MKEEFKMSVSVIMMILVVVQIVVVGSLVVLLFRALLKYIRSGEQREETKQIRMSLGEALKENRMRMKMTQEFVAEALGVSRQAVSKWERGESDPSTSNLIAVAKLYGISAEELLREVE